MKIFEVTTVSIRQNGEYGDEHQSYLGFDLEEATDAKEQALINYANASSRDQAQSVVEARVYEIADDTDINDRDAIIEAMCECSGYDLI